MLPMSRMRLLRRWLVSVALVLGVLAGDGLHELAHSHGVLGEVSAASGQLEVHSGNCPHRPHVPMHPDRGCLLCQHGVDLHTLVAPGCRVQTQTLQPAQLVESRPDVVGQAPVPGGVGARAPPLMSV